LLEGVDQKELIIIEDYVSGILGGLIEQTLPAEAHVTVGLKV